ncbi:TetR/AcrR family transcriptional regulator [Actinomadura algeriensis]|uniref:AcrR family transcriptional regulator n=1 Tax=Actinomadura algeriensis TaxID=1679523 RepID=A0ABR9JMG1_9ACTN|nr:TetR/AcrR family transcriptional regulator [Actinomadura algeriensis]MBE1531315.1 AcrR family transcriptional regulator [Actinomadura algeriensis]
MVTTRGGGDRRQAILEGAFTVFARRGYAQACVKEVAAEAGVAKPTVYNHLNDKATLFRHAIQAAAQTVLDERLAVLDLLKDADGDLPATLHDVGYRLLRLHTDDRACALRRLLYSEITHFPDILDVVTESGPHRLIQALADRLARLALAGRLRITDPDLAAEQFLALLTGPLEVRTRMGTRPIDDTALNDLALAAVESFLQIFGPRATTGAGADMRKAAEPVDRPQE